MNNLQISQALDGDDVTKQIFVGVYAADTLPIKEYPGAYICNTDTSSEPGRHCFAFFSPRPGILESFDSFGWNPRTYSSHIRNWIDEDELKYSRSVFQTQDSVVCGNYCILFILLRSYQVSYDDIVSILTKNKTINDHFVHKFVNKYFNVKTKLCDREYLLAQLKRNS